MNKDTIKIKQALEAAERDLETLQRNIRKSLADPDYALASLADVSKAIATLSADAEQQEEAPTSSCIGVTHVTQQSDGRFLVVDAPAAPDAQPQEQPIGWQFFDGGRWWYGDDRIKDHRKNTEDAGYPVRDIYAAPVQPASKPELSATGVAKDWSVTVEVEGFRVLCISSGHIAGVPELEPYEATIQCCAENLLSFIGCATSDAEQDEEPEQDEELDPHIDGVVPTRMTEDEKAFISRATRCATSKEAQS